MRLISIYRKTLGQGRRQFGSSGLYYLQLRQSPAINHYYSSRTTESETPDDRNKDGNTKYQTEYPKSSFTSISFVVQKLIKVFLGRTLGYELLIFAIIQREQIRAIAEFSIVQFNFEFESEDLEIEDLWDYD